MRTSSGASSLPLVSASTTANGSTESRPPQSDSSASFHDVLQQEDGDSPSPTPTGNVATPASANATPAATPVTTITSAADEAIQAATDAAATESDLLPANSPAPSTGVPAKATAAPATKNNFTALISPTGLSAMMVQAAAQTKPTPVTKMTAPSTGKSATATASGQNDASVSSSAQPVLGRLDLASLIAQATNIVANAAPTSVAKTPTGPAVTSPAGPKPGSSPSATSANNAAVFNSSAPDLSTLIAQAAILSSNSASLQGAPSPAGTTSSATIAALNTAPGSVTATALMLGKEMPAAGSNQGGTTSAAKEKKSASTGSEGTFLHSGTAGTTTTSSTFNLLAATFAGMNQSTTGEQLTDRASSKNLALDNVSGTAAGIGGTANVEKGTAMNTTFSFPEIFAGTNTVPQQTPVDMQIKLSTNHDFEDALKQVMHVAQLTQTSPTSRVPMRVEMEIQTPPGAIVNVYVSKQNDQWRAQLSTNDPQALAWVQDKMSSLRGSNDLGVEVRWLPPQMESITTSGSSSESGLGWDRGGQQQQSNQQQSDQQQSGRQKRAELYAGIGAGQFMEALTAVGSAA
jgi:hypothetical protein